MFPIRHMRIYAVSTVIALLLALTSTFVATPVVADERSEYRLRAAFIYNFIRFMRWPDAIEKQPDDKLVLCLQGMPLAYTVMSDELSGKSIKQRHITVKQIQKNEEIPGCWILYRNLPPSSQATADSLQHSNHGVLTIGENPDAMRDTDIVRFFSESDRLRFEINPKLGEQSGIVISSKLLRLARILKNTSVNQ